MLEAIRKALKVGIPKHILRNFQSCYIFMNKFIVKMLQNQFNQLLLDNIINQNCKQ